MWPVAGINENYVRAAWCNGNEVWMRNQITLAAGHGNLIRNEWHRVVELTNRANGHTLCIVLGGGKFKAIHVVPKPAFGLVDQNVICFIILRMLARWFSTLCAVVFVFPICAREEALIRIGEVWRYHKGARPNEWHKPEFDDSRWRTARSGLVLPEDQEITVLANRPGQDVPLFIRRTFRVADPADIRWLTLLVEHEKGFVAYLNGVEVARYAGLGIILRDEHGEGEHDVLAVERDLSRFRDLLVAGENVLALEGTQTSQSDSTFSLAAALVANFSRGPFVQNATTTSIQVIWRTPAPASTFIEYGPSAAMGLTMTNGSLVTEHVVTLTGLEANTRYYYRVGSDDGQGAVISTTEGFRTLKNSGPISFLVFGDSGQGTTNQFRIADLLRRTPADLVLHSGDIIYGGFRDPNIDTRFFNFYQPHMKNVPYYLSIGNHDLNCCAGDGAPDWNPTNWPANVTNYQKAYYLPTNSITGTEHFYSFDHGDAHFVALYIPWYANYVFTNGSDQYMWLTNDLARSSKPWKFMFWHMPVANSGLHASRDDNANGIIDRAELLDLISPLARDYGLNLVFCGHDHNFERFAPTNGLHYIVTGGGGGGLYTFSVRHPASAQFWSVHHATKVTVQGDTAVVQALRADGSVVDRMVVHRNLAAPRIYSATWNTPTIESGPANNSDGNITGQTFDLIGPAIPSRHGLFSNPGELYVNNDSANLYLGIRGAMFYGNNNLFLFIESPRQNGVNTMAGLGNGIVDPGGQGVDGLDCLENLSFTEFSPNIACVLGDETADGHARSFSRSGLGLNIGQGVFRLDSNLTTVEGARLQQFNRSPESGPAAAEQNADLIEIGIPFSALGPGIQPGDLLKIAVIVGGYEFDAVAQTRHLDTAVLGTSLSGSGQGPVVLGAVTVRLAFPPDLDSDEDGLLDNWELAHDLNQHSDAGDHGAGGDPDEDGFTNAQEQVAGTNPRDSNSALRLRLSPIAAHHYRISWDAIPGKLYQLQYSSALPNFDLLDSRTATFSEESYENDLSTNMPPPALRYYRLSVVP